MGEISVKEYLLTYVWAGLECYAATLLFDGFSERKLKQSRYWIVAAGFVFLDATVLICLEPAMASFGRMLFAFVSYFIFHFILYESGHIFRLYITAGCAKYEKRTVNQRFLRFNINFTNGLPILGRARLAKYIQMVEIHMVVGDSV